MDEAPVASAQALNPIEFEPAVARLDEVAGPAEIDTAVRASFASTDCRVASSSRAEQALLRKA